MCILSITKSAITAKNISSGFSATGTWPVNTNIVREVDFLPSQVTDRILPNPETEQPKSAPQITGNSEGRTSYQTIGTAKNDSISEYNTGAGNVAPSFSTDLSIPAVYVS